jgi:GntR family transcriptional regulator, transcriptional repressor for pyruvate dehydrogenase complex
MAAIGRPSRASEIADEVRRTLLSSGLHEGDRLMTEAQLAKQYGVSRGIAREAVGRLRALGLLESRQRKGIVVGRSDPVHLVASALPMYHQSAKDLVSLARLRYVLEIGGIELAVRNATADQIRRLRELAGRFAVWRGKLASAAKANELDLAFHRLLLEMTGDPLLAGMHQVLAEYFHLETKAAANRIAVDEVTCWQHTAIVAAVEARDVEQARALLRQHLQGIMDLAERHKPADPKRAIVGEVRK